MTSIENFQQEQAKLYGLPTLIMTVKQLIVEKVGGVYLWQVSLKHRSKIWGKTVKFKVWVTSSVAFSLKQQTQSLTIDLNIISL
jgi:hypothetical protein